MHRVRIAPDTPACGIVVLSKTEAHYVARVLRLGVGDEIDVFDGAGGQGRLCLTRVSSLTVEGQLVAPLLRGTSLPKPLILGQGLPKGSKMDLIVEKCSELGLTALVPLLTERTVVREVPKRQVEKLARWRRVAEAAARQCGRPALLELHAPMSLVDFCESYRAAAVKIVCWEEEQQQGLRQVLSRQAGQSPLVVLLGPEGGLTSEEVAVARVYGFVSVSLGSRILRTETAAVAVTAIIRYSWNELEPQGEER